MAAPWPPPSQQHAGNLSRFDEETGYRWSLRRPRRGQTTPSSSWRWAVPSTPPPAAGPTDFARVDCCREGAVAQQQCSAVTVDLPASMVENVQGTLQSTPAQAQHHVAARWRRHQRQARRHAAQGRDRCTCPTCCTRDTYTQVPWWRQPCLARKLRLASPTFACWTIREKRSTLSLCTIRPSPTC